jgi:hypothetical protein
MEASSLRRRSHPLRLRPSHQRQRRLSTSQRLLDVLSRAFGFASSSTTCDGAVTLFTNLGGADAGTKGRELSNEWCLDKPVVNRDGATVLSVMKYVSVDVSGGVGLTYRDGSLAEVGDVVAYG